MTLSLRRCSPVPTSLAAASLAAALLAPALLAPVLLTTGCAPAPQAPAAATLASPYRSVHIDTLAPGKVEQFEAARREWVAEMRARHASDLRGIFVQVEPNVFYTIRPFDHFAELDTRTEVVNRALAPVSKEAADRYDRGSDTALAFPHASEIWQVDRDLSYAPAEGKLDEATGACGRMVVDDVRPDPASSDAYWGAVAAIDHALGEAHYPLSSVAYRSMYGSGHVVTLWLARSPEQLSTTPTVETALTRALGDKRASEILAARDGAVVHREVHVINVRHDLDSP